MPNQKQNQIENIKQRIFGKQKEYNVLDIYHYMMIHYGYIPFEDFKKMDAYLVDELINRINKMNEKENRSGRRGKF